MEKFLYHDMKNNVFIVQIKQLTQAVIKKSPGNNYVEIMKSGELILTYKDIIKENGKFIRELGKRTYHYNENNKLEMVTIFKSNNYNKSIFYIIYVLFYLLLIRLIIII